MTTTIEQLKSLASTLPAQERADLAHFLLWSLDAEEEGAAEAWKVEIARRVNEIRSGTAQGRPVDEVMAELEERYP